MRHSTENTSDQLSHQEWKNNHSSTDISAILSTSKIRTSHLIRNEDWVPQADDINNKALFTLNATKSVAQELLQRVNDIRDGLWGRLSENHLSEENRKNLLAIEKSLRGIAQI
jgi:hypothetical protein